MGGVEGGVMHDELHVLVSDDFAVDENEGLVGRKALLGNIIFNFPYPHCLSVVITSSWASAMVFMVVNMFWISPKYFFYISGGIVLTIIVVVIGVVIRLL